MGKRIVTLETRKKISQYQKGRKKKPESIAKTVAAKIKQWSDLSYMGKHRRIWKKYGKANKCESFSCDESCKYFEWANVSGKYLEDISDWKMMCCRCHKLFDLGRKQ